MFLGAAMRERTIILVVAAGGALGAVLRYLLSGWAQALGGARFPWGTLAVNVLGSFVIGLLMAAFLEHATTSPITRAFWVIGVIGGFTTYSAFSYETVTLLTVGDWTAGGANVLANLVLGVTAAFVGVRLGSL
ncbi:MAG TPA: fluoride efflux transporter CrcB [Gemmatimonadota bacterium]|nr:fluoride efflux transporter CrcB [Gemmatimonadota bacterium]